MKGCCFTAERWFSALLIIAVVLGATWFVLLEPVVTAELVLVSLLGVMGVLAIATMNRATSGAMMPLFFIAAIVYNAYVYLAYVAEVPSVSAYLMQPAGYLLVSTSLLSLVGLILAFTLCSQKKTSCSPENSSELQEKASAMMVARNGKLPAKMIAAASKKSAKKAAGKKAGKKTMRKASKRRSKS